MLKKNEEKIKFNKILRLTRKNAQKGLEIFYNEYGKAIYLAAKSVGCSHEKAQVVVNSVLIKIWKKRDKIKNIKNPKAWLSTVAKNTARDELGEVWHLELKEEICQAEDEFQKTIDKDSYEYCLTPLNEYEKELVTLKIVSKYCFQELADYYEKPLPTITTTFYRAMAKMKNFLLTEENCE